jgi:Protein of unknown function (DUF2917)
MLAPRNAPMVLERRGLHRIQDGAGLTILCLKGTIWLTQQDDVRDIILGAGESFALDRAGLAVLYALSPACMTVLAKAHVPGRLVAAA